MSARAERLRGGPGEPFVEEFSSLNRPARVTHAGAARVREAMLAPATLAWMQRVLVSGACRGSWSSARV